MRTKFWCGKGNVSSVSNKTEGCCSLLNFLNSLIIRPLVSSVAKLFPDNKTYRKKEIKTRSYVMKGILVHIWKLQIKIKGIERENYLSENCYDLRYMKSSRANSSILKPERSRHSASSA